YDDIIAGVEQIKSVLKGDASRLEFFFKKPNDLKIELGWLILGKYMDYQLEAILDDYQQLSLQERLFEVYWSIYSFFDESLAKREDIQKNWQEGKLFSFVQEQLTSDDTKYKLLYLYHNHELLLNELVTLLLEVKKVLAEVLKPFEGRIQAFMDNIELKLQENAHKFLEDQYGFSKNDDVMTEIYPSIIPSYTVTLQNATDASESLILGINTIKISELKKTYSCDEEKLLNILKSISDKSKLEVLKALKEGKLYGGQLAERFKLSNATISYHMSNLVSLDLVHIEKENNRIYYSLNTAKISEYLDGLRSLLLV
ncbi:MAG: ArsR family transcriptional regulator, partial [Clostridia bacterium]|nr:ArsR family transcriptional regulator [Clostridia bacterium]